jgi:hypothetical protein
MPIAMYRCLIRKVIAQTYAANCQGQSLGGWWAARRRLDRLYKSQETQHAGRNP